MKLSPQEQALVDAMSEWEIIDCHEHLAPESDRLDRDVDVFTLFSHYTRGDLTVAGMSQADYDGLFNRQIPLDVRWRTFKPYWEQIRWGSYARAALLATKRFFGFDDINDATYGPISEAIAAHNTPGLYQRVLGDACKIRVALTQCGQTDLGSPLLVPVMPMIHDVETWDAITHSAYDPRATVRTLDDLLDAMRTYVLRVKGAGAVGLKMVSNPYSEASRQQALDAFATLRDGKEQRLPGADVRQRGANPLRDYMVDQTIDFATRQDLVIAVHTGYWGDFRELDPLHMIPILQRHPKARFDIYHLGYPWVRQALMLGKGFPNVWLNWCWTHIISQKFAVDGLDEAIDLVPMNKILAFGADYGVPVEKTYGHLVMAREDIACALAHRIERDQMTETQALALAHQWLWDNPVDLYRLDVRATQ